MHQNKALLAKLLSTNESARFRAKDLALEQMAALTRQDIEEALTALGKKNVSMLIYVCIQNRDSRLYALSPPARMVLETADGAYPNIAYYYARVEPSRGLEALFVLYHRHPARHLPICLAIGETKLPDASEFLLSEARKTKSGGGSMLAQLLGLKYAANAIDTEDLFWMLEQKLEREEVITMAELDVRLTDEELRSLWRASGVKRHFAIQSILGDPETHYDTLGWVVQQYLDTGDLDTVRQLLQSDTMRAISAPPIVKYRESILKKINKTARDQI